MQRATRCCLFTYLHDAYDGRLFSKEALSLRRAGYEVVIILPTCKLPEDTEGVEFLFYPHQSLPRFFFLQQLLRLFIVIRLGIKANADVYHCHAPPLLCCAFVIRLYQRIFRRKRSLIIHEIRDFYLQETSLDHSPGLAWRWFLVVWKRLDRFLQRRCDHIIGTEECKVEASISYGIPCDRISVIPHYVRLELFPPVPKTFDPRNFVVAYEGMLMFLRGLDKIAEACVALGKRRGIRVKMLIAGVWCDQEESRVLVDYCEKNREFVDLQLLGWIPHHTVSKMLTQADVCCVVFFSKRYERVLSGTSAPIKVYEYMASGKPIIGSNLSSLRHSIGEAHCGILVDVDQGAQGIADAMEFYYVHPECLVEHGANARRAAEERFNWPIAEKAFLGIYARLLSSRPNSCQPL